jgi:hypothetical protein
LAVHHGGLGRRRRQLDALGLQLLGQLCGDFVAFDLRGWRASRNV